MWAPYSHRSEHALWGRELWASCFLATLWWEVFEFWVWSIVQIARIHRILLGRSHKISLTKRGNYWIRHLWLRAFSKCWWLISWPLVDVSFMIARVLSRQLLGQQILRESAIFFAFYDDSTTTIVLINFIKCTWQVFYRIHHLLMVHLHSNLPRTAGSLSRHLLFLSLWFRVLCRCSTIEDIVCSILLVLHDFHFPLESGVEMILDVIISATWEEFSDLRPAIP